MVIAIMVVVIVIAVVIGGSGGGGSSRAAVSQSFNTFLLVTKFPRKFDIGTEAAARCVAVSMEATKQCRHCRTMA